MKYHIIFKFIAIALCAAMLMGAVGSAFGMFALTQSGLYNRDVEEAYNDFVATHTQALAEEIVQRYASMHLGGANAQIVDAVYGNYWSNQFFDLDRVSYVIRDEAGKELDAKPMGVEPVRQLDFVASDYVSYIRILSQMPEEEYEAANGLKLPEGITTQNGEDYVYSAIPETGADVYYAEVHHEDGSFGIGSAEEPLGTVVCHENGIVEFFGVEGVDLLQDTAMVTGIRFLTRDETCIYEAHSPRGVLSEGSYEDDTLRLVMRLMVETASILDAIPGEGCYVTRMSVTYEDDYSESIGGTPQIGFLNHEGDRVRFVPSDPGLLSYKDLPVIHIAFYDQNEMLVYEARDPEGVGYFGDHGGEFSFLTLSGTAQSPAETIPEETEPDAEMGARAVIRKKTPIWVRYAGEFDKQSYYYGKDYEVTIYSVMVQDGRLFGCTSSICLTMPEAPAEWVAMEDVQILSQTFSGGDRGQPALCNARTEIWALDGEECYPTDLYYQEGQQIGILVLGSFDSGQWGLTDMGWVKLDTITWLEGVSTAQFLEEALPAPQETTVPEQTVPDVTEAAEVISGELADTMMETIVPEETVDTSVEETTPTEADASVAAPEETIPAGVEVAMEAFLLEEEQEADSGEVYTYGYWDSASQQSMVAEYVFEDMPSYTVELELGDGAIRTENNWLLARTLYTYRNELPYLLGICLLLFAVLAVYLCCAAGRKPGTKVVRFEGLNRLPLDLYGVITVGGVLLAAWVAVIGGQYLMESSIRIGILFAGLMVYAACLLIVGFCFACAAQFKTPGLWWWRHSVCFLSFKLLGFLCRKLLQWIKWLTKKCETRLWPAFVRLCKGAVKVVTALLKIGGIWIGKLLTWLQKGGDWLWNRLTRFFSLLPLTWQWLLAGFGMFLLIAMVFATNGEELLIVLCIGICISLILYGAHCFGTLLEGVKHMRKGDLDEKVDDRLMVGAFREFAEELNGLADVAVVAAQKQLKSERMKTELITNVSHDIKTPLTSIINYVDLMQKPHSEAEGEKYLEVLDRQSQRLKKLIEDLMEMSKASTGNLAVDVTCLDAAETVNQALGEFADKLERAQLFPVFRQPEETVYMMADGRLVWRVMSNLLSNAVKYALPGTRVYVDLQKLENKVIISIKNISREELNVEADELMERFVRGDTSRNTEGSGLGLNIAQSLMELQKGQLQILVDGDLFKVTLIFPGAE